MKNSKEITDKFLKDYHDGILPFPNLTVKSGHLVCGNCGKEHSIYNILGNLNNYCGNCGIRLGFPYNEGGVDDEGDQ